jgi:hypothetical protein
MKAKLLFSRIREHSEQLRTLATALTASLETLEQALGDHDMASPEDAALLDWVAEFNGGLYATATLFSQRLHPFLERISSPLPSGPPHPPEDCPSPPQSEPRDRVSRRGTPEYAAFPATARAALAGARDTVAQSHHLCERARDALNGTAELYQHLQARRDREAEHRAALGGSQPHSPTVPASASLPPPYPREPPRR